MKKKVITILSALLTASLLLSGCQSNAPIPSENPSGQSASDVPADGASEQSVDGQGERAQITSEPTEIRFSWWGSDNRHEAIESVIALYMEKNPNVTIKPDYGPWDGWQQNILTQLGGQMESDIVQVNYNWVHSFGKGKNVFADLNDYANYIQLENWNQEYLDAMTVGGELGAVPHGMNARAVLYSKPLFEEAGISYPATYEELIAAGAVIGKDNTSTGTENKYAFMNIGKECPDLFIAQMLFDQTGKIMQVDGQVQYTQEEVAKVFSQYLEFANSGAMETFQQLNAIDNESNPVWTSGRGGSVYEWINAMDKYIGSYKAGEAREEIAVAPYIVPTAGDQSVIYVKPNLGYAVSKNSKNPEVAADFINFFFTDPEAVKMLGTSIGISSNQVTKEIQLNEGFLSGVMQEGYDMLDQYEQVVMDPYFEDSNIRGERYAAIEAFRSGKNSVEEAAADYIDRQQAALDKLLK